MDPDDPDRQAANHRTRGLFCRHSTIMTRRQPADTASDSPVFPDAQHIFRQRYHRPGHIRGSWPAGRRKQSRRMPTTIPTAPISDAWHRQHTRRHDTAYRSRRMAVGCRIMATQPSTNAQTPQWLVIDTGGRQSSATVKRHRAHRWLHRPWGRKERRFSRPLANTARH